MTQDPILSVRGLQIRFGLRGRTLHAIRDIDLDLYRGEVLALVGEKNELDSTIAELRKQRRDKDISLNDSARLRMEIKRLEKDAANLTNQIKETCHG